MEGRPTLLLASLLVALPALAGCIATGGTPSPEQALVGHESMAAMTAPVDGLLDLRGEKCNMAGGVSQNPIPTPFMQFENFSGFIPKPFAPADTTEYLGLPTGDATNAAVFNLGNAHIAVECHEWMVNGHHRHMASFGWIALVVEAPKIEGVEPAPRNYLVATLATRDDDLAKAIHDNGGRPIPGIAYAGGEEEGGFCAAEVVCLPWAGEGWPVEAVVETAGDGIYTTDLLMQAAGKAPSTIRLWFVFDRPDGQLHLAYLDLKPENGEWYTGQGVFSHQFTSKHAGNRADAAMGGLGIKGFDFTATLTVLPATTDEMWMH